VNLSNVRRLSVFIFLATATLASGHLVAQNLTLEGQTGGFITPTAYVVYSAKDHFFSHPAVGYHFVDANSVIGDLHTFSIEEGVANRAEAGYTREVHWTGDSADFSSLWHYAGMNIFNGKGVAIKDGQFGPWTPGLAGGFVVRTGDKFVSGALGQELAGLQGIVAAVKNYTNEDVYVAATKTWLHPPVPFLVNLAGKPPTPRSTGSAGSRRGLADGCSAGWGFRCRGRSRRRLCRRPDSRRSRRR